MRKSLKRDLRNNLILKTGSLFIAISAFFISAPVQAVEVSATVDRNEMTENDTFTLTVSVSSDKSVSTESPRLPGLKGFDLINSWQGSETRSSFVNGDFQVQRVQRFNYMLAPKKKGNFRIEPVQIVVDGKAYNTKPINVKILAGSASPKPQRQRPRNQQRGLDPFGDVDSLFSQFLKNRPRPGFQSQPINPKEAFFIQVDVDKTEVYEGEQLMASWYIYTRGQISDIDTLKYPSLNGFWKEDIEVATRLNFRSEVINGIPYQKALLASYALFPIKSGTARIDPYKAKCTVITRNNLGFGRPYVYTKASKQVKVKVLPIPRENRPNDFTGAVGNFNVTATLDSNTVEANQAITMKVRFSGTGNAKTIDLPALNLPNSIEVYDTKKDSKFYKNGTSYKEFEVLLIPREAGEVTIDPISVSLFDPDNKRFYQRKTPRLTFTVTPGQGSANSIPSAPLADRSSEESLSNAPRVPGLLLSWKDTSGFIANRSNALVMGGYGLALLFLIWKAFLELGFARRKKTVLEQVQLRFKKVSELQGKGDWRAVGTEVLNIFYYLLGEISGQGGAAVKLEAMLDKIPPSVRREVGEDLKTMLKKFEVLSFAPEEIVGDMKEKAQLKKLVKDMEKLLRKSIDLGLGTKQS